MKLTNDKHILLSIINTKLRDQYASLEELCDDLEINMEDLIQRLKLIHYEYNRELNAFVVKSKKEV